MDPRDANKLMRAAHAWAWFHGVKVNCKCYPIGADGLRAVRCTLVDNKRIRDFG